MNKSEFEYIQVHTKYLRNILEKDVGNPDAIKEAYEMRTRLAKLTVLELDREKLNFHEVSVAIHELDKLLDGDDVGEY